MSATLEALFFAPLELEDFPFLLSATLGVFGSLEATERVGARGRGWSAKIGISAAREADLLLEWSKLPTEKVAELAWNYEGRGRFPMRRKRFFSKNEGGNKSCGSLHAFTVNYPKG